MNAKQASLGRPTSASDFADKESQLLDTTKAAEKTLESLVPPDEIKSNAEHFISVVDQLNGKLGDALDAAEVNDRGEAEPAHRRDHRAEQDRRRGRERDRRAGLPLDRERVDACRGGGSAPSASAKSAPTPARCHVQSTVFETRKAPTAGPASQRAGVPRARHSARALAA